MRDRNKEIVTFRTEESFKKHLKKTSKPNQNAWIVATLKKESGYKEPVKK